ncbi:MAG: DUF3300 domain-containing protein [Verrucomicrobia bacterium]|nr:DUF3300 domain-containing protein [Verrucomicrobiota bacterium]
MKILIAIVLAASASVLNPAALLEAADSISTSPPPVAGAVPPPSAPAQRSAAELAKLAEPIALHPDPLLAIILPAAVYPLEIVQAARFVKNTNNIPKVDQQPWDENVKAAARFPDLIAKLDADLEWTVELGKAFLEQPKELMDAIQALRARAHQAGTLQSSSQQVVTVTNVVVIQTNVMQVVTVTNQIVQVQPANPEIVYVPTYPPTVYYPPPAYVYDPYAPLVTFGVGIAVGAIIANNCDWHGGAIWVGGGGAVWVGGGGYHGDVDIDIDIDNVNINRGNQVNTQGGNRTASTGATATQQKWQPDQNRLSNSGAPTATQTRDARGWGSPTAQPNQRAGAGGATSQQPTYNWSQRPSTGTQPTRAPGAAPSATPAQRPMTGARPATTPSAQPAMNRPAQTPTAARPSPAPSTSQSSARSSSAFSGVNSGSSAYNAGNRGAASRGGGARAGGARGGGGRGR